MLLNAPSDLGRVILSVLVSTDPILPTSKWNCLIPQYFLTLNILINSRVNPKISDHAYPRSNFDFNAIPVAPPITRVFIHSKFST